MEGGEDVLCDYLCAVGYATHESGCEMRQYNLFYFISFPLNSFTRAHRRGHQRTAPSRIVEANAYLPLPVKGIKPKEGPEDLIQPQACPNAHMIHKQHNHNTTPQLYQYADYSVGATCLEECE